MADYPAFWRRKMHRLFTLVDSRKQGYITEDELWEQYQHLMEEHPELESHWREIHAYEWKDFLNNGRDVPKGYKLTEEEFYKNLWTEAQQPDFLEKIQKVTEKSFERLDMEHKGYCTMKEYVKLVKGLDIDEEKAKWIFDAIDTDHDGKMDVKNLCRAKHFYFTDTSDESNPLNLIYGPLD